MNLNTISLAFLNGRSYLPFLAAIFGFIAYILTDLGTVTVAGSGSPSNYLNATDIGTLNLTGLRDATLNGTTLSASGALQLTAKDVASFSANIGNNTRMAVCFIVGFATNSFIEKLTELSEKM